MKFRLREIREKKIFLKEELSALLGKEILKNRPLTLGEAARLLETNKPNLSKLERKWDARPHPKIIEKITNLFGVSHEQLYSEYIGDDDLLTELVKLRKENEQLRRMVKELSEML